MAWAKKLETEELYVFNYTKSKWLINTSDTPTSTADPYKLSLEADPLSKWGFTSRIHKHKPQTRGDSKIQQPKRVHL